MEKRAWILSIVLIFLVSFSSAEITLNQPLETYNLGDRLYINAEGIRGVSEGNLNLNLVCANNSINLERMSARRYSPNEEYSYELPYKILTPEDLEISDISKILGNCQVILSMGDQSASTTPFLISNEVSLTANLDQESYDPSRPITLTVEAVKKNGNLLNGFIEATGGATFSKVVEEGSVIETFFTSETLEAGLYAVNLVVYDVGASGSLNKGTTTVYYKINAVPTSIILSLSGEQITPGQEFTVSGEVFDQSGKKIEGSINIKMTSPSQETFVTSIEAGDSSEIVLKTNATAGVWKIQATYDGLLEEREITVLEVEKVSFEFQDSVLVIRNIGNVIYDKIINLQIGNETRELALIMDLNEERKFNIQAPNGEYEITVNDGEESISSSVVLTGKAISINDLSSNIFRNYTSVWIFLILILGGIGVVLLIRFKRTKTLGAEYPRKKFSDKFRGLKNKFHKKVPSKMKEGINNSLAFTNKSPSSLSLDDKVYENKNQKVLGSTRKHIVKGAESTLVLKGEKANSSVIAISVKNYESLSEIAIESLKEIVSCAKQNKGLVDWRGEYIFIVFSPLVTRTYSNEILASKTAFEILNKLKTYNRKFKSKIEFGIGVNSGELISSKEGGKLKYTTVGNTISFSKRLANFDNSKALISDEIRKKLLRNLKVIKIGDLRGKDVYEITEIKDKGADEARLKDLLRRIEQ